MYRVFAVLMLCSVPFVPIANAAPITIETVPVGNVGNANDPLTGNKFGGVNYNYRIGTYEVTNAQYAAFLNAKAVSDTHGSLYRPSMTQIVRSGVNGSFAYSPAANFGNKPVNNVTLIDAARFTNWLHNGQGDGDTETGAYTTEGGTPTSVTRTPNARWFLPTENEWYKAAYYQPVEHGGDVDNYWLYPTRSNTSPTIATANAVGDISNPGANVANSARAGWMDGLHTTVGSAGPLSTSFYGTYDQSGNVAELTETVYEDLVNGQAWIERGGSYAHREFFQRSPFRLITTKPGAEIGFRVATLYVPEPSSIALAAVGLAGLAAWGWRRRSR